MSIDFKESLFRFIFPPIIFWGLMVISKTVSSTNLSSGDFLVKFILTGIVISSVSAGITNLLGIWKGPGYWLNKKGEYGNWKNLAEKSNEYVRGKIERRWNFYTTNLASLVATIFFLIFYGLQRIFFLLELDCKDWSIPLFSISLFILFLSLTLMSFKQSKYFNQRVSQEKN